MFRTGRTVPSSCSCHTQPWPWQLHMPHVPKHCAQVPRSLTRSSQRKAGNPLKRGAMSKENIVLHPITAVSRNTHVRFYAGCCKADEAHWCKPRAGMLHGRTHNAAPQAHPARARCRPRRHASTCKGASKTSVQRPKPAKALQSLQRHRATLSCEEHRQFRVRRACSRVARKLKGCSYDQHPRAAQLASCTVPCCASGAAAASASSWPAAFSCSCCCACSSRCRRAAAAPAAKGQLFLVQPL